MRNEYMFSNTFNTTQFIDVSNPKQRAAGNTVFRDLSNPGDYYMETSSGHVYRINRQEVIVSSEDNTYSTSVNETNYCINLRNAYQGKNKPLGYALITDRNQRLARIQYFSDMRKRRNNNTVVSSTSNMDGIIINKRYFPA
jgi:hypothetical protein